MSNIAVQIALNNQNKNCRPGQKAVHFRPGTTEWWAVLCDNDAGDPYYPRRRFFRCQDGLNFSYVANWEPELELGSPAAIKPQSTSFVFSADGNYIHAATVFELNIGTPAITYYGIVWGKLDLSTMLWTNTFLVQSTRLNDMYQWADIVLDGRDRPVLIAHVTAGTNDRADLFYYDANLRARVVQIDDGTVKPDSYSSLCRMGDYIYIHCQNSSNYAFLYRIVLDENGAPVIPAHSIFQRLGQTDLDGAQMSVGGGVLGIVGTARASGYAAFRYFDGSILHDTETIIDQSIAENSYCLCYRDGKWKATYTLTSNGRTYLTERFAADEWQMAEGVNLTSDTWWWCNMTADELNPVGMEPTNFGFLCMKSTGVSTWAADFVYFDYTPPAVTENHWGYGDLTGTVLAFGIDVERGQCQILQSDSPSFKIMDAYDVGGETLFATQQKFFDFWEEYKDYVADDDYADREFMLLTGAEDGNTNKIKLADEISLLFDIDADAWLDVRLMNDLGEVQELVGDPDAGGDALVIADRGKAFGVGLEGRDFRVEATVRSNKYFHLDNIELHFGTFGGMD